MKSVTLKLWKLINKTVPRLSFRVPIPVTESLPIPHPMDRKWAKYSSELNLTGRDHSIKIAVRGYLSPSHCTPVECVCTRSSLPTEGGAGLTALLDLWWHFSMPAWLYFITEWTPASSMYQHCMQLPVPLSRWISCLSAEAILGWDRAL